MPGITYSDELAAKIIEKLHTMSLTQLCTSKDMPNRQTVGDWMEKYPSFAASCTRARADHAERILEKANLDLQQAKSLDDGRLADLKFKGQQWMAARLLSRKYGDSLKVSGDAVADPVQVVIRHVACPDPNKTTKE
jgi:hypothetical protein